MTTLEPVSISLSVANRQLALILSQTQKDEEKSRQIRHNILSVSAVEQYFSYLDIETSHENSDSFDMIQQSLTDSADLMLSNLGKIECRPVLANQDFMVVPPEVWGDRIGYLAVQLNEDLTEGKILGFVKAVHQTQIPITDLQSLDEFLDYLDYLEKLEPLLLNLKNWLSRVTQSGWTIVSEAIDEMLPESSPEMQWAFRSRSTITTDQGVTCQKRLSQIPFRISLYPRMALDYDYDIIVRLNLESLSMASPMDTRGKPSQEKSQPLENELNVAILDENRSLVKEEIFHIGHETTDTAVTFDIQADQGDSFIIKVAYQGDITEEIINL